LANNSADWHSTLSIPLKILSILQYPDGTKVLRPLPNNLEKWRYNPRAFKVNAKKPRRLLWAIAWDQQGNSSCARTIYFYRRKKEYALQSGKGYQG